jgi:hypothetical protein
MSGKNTDGIAIVKLGPQYRQCTGVETAIRQCQFTTFTERSVRRKCEQQLNK